MLSCIMIVKMRLHMKHEKKRISEAERLEQLLKKASKDAAEILASVDPKAAFNRKLMNILKGR